MKGLSVVLKKLGGKFAGKMASKTIMKRLLLGSFTNIFTSVLIWIIEFFLHPFIKKWREDLLRALGWQKEKEESNQTAIVKKET